VAIEPQVVCTDCIEGLKRLPEKSVAAIVTSPPYNIGVKYSKHKDSRPDYLEWMEKVFVECKRVLADNGHFFLQMGGIAKDPLIPQRVLQRALNAGFELQNEIVWVKSITVGNESYGPFKPLNSKRFVNRTHESIFHLTKTGEVLLDRLAVGVPFKDKSNIGRFGHEEDLRCRGSVWFIPYETVRSRKERYNHPATFPVELPRRCIKLSGIPIGSLVVDPFVGTGTTLVACQELGMRGLGFDIDEKYVSSAKARLGLTESERPESVQVDVKERTAVILQIEERDS
jgi:site-specific DNA-methyltransferase (adenine-specific)